jgi:hypothetical protein
MEVPSAGSNSRLSPCLARSARRNFRGTVTRPLLSIRCYPFHDGNPRLQYSQMKIGKKRGYNYTAFFEANEHGGYTVTWPCDGRPGSGPRTGHRQGCRPQLRRWPEEGERTHSSRTRRFQSSRRPSPKTPPLQKAQGWGTRKFKGWRTRQY